MSGRTPIWRAILWIERFLPTPAENLPKSGDDARSSRWRFAILPIVVVAMVLPGLVRDRAIFAEMWQIWRPIIAQSALFLLIVVGLAAAVSGIVVWRRERRNHA